MNFFRKEYLFLFALLIGLGCTNKLSVSPSAPPTLSATAIAPTVPVLKGLETNPLLRVRIYVPAGSPQVTYRQLRVRLNEAGVQALDKLDVFFTGSEALFNDKNRVASLTPSATTLDIPVALTLKPGLHYVWFSATVKDGADIDQKVELRCTALSDGAGKELAVVEEGTGYVHRLGVALRKAWQDSVHTYRIPGIVATDKGTLIAVYDNRYTTTRDLPGNIDVGMSRSTDGGRTWEPMKVVMDMGEPHENNGIGDPCVLFDPVTKTIWVAALWSKGNRSIGGSKPGLTPDETGQFVVVSSSDDGLTWSEPLSITPQVKDPVWRIFFPGPGSGIAMQDGKLVFPAQYWDANGMPHSTLVYSADHGKTWKSGIGAKSNTTEAQIVETTPGTLMLNMRDNRGSFRSVATTTDLGQSWTEHHTSYKSLIDPVCMAGFIKATVKVQGQAREVLLFSNVASSTARLDMTIKASLDLGESWQPAHQVLVDERRCYGYSSLVKVDDNTVGLLYEGTRELYFVRVPVNEIIQ